MGKSGGAWRAESRRKGRNWRFWAVFHPNQGARRQTSPNPVSMGCGGLKGRQGLELRSRETRREGLDRRRLPPGLCRGFQSLVRSTFSFRFMVSVYERHPRLSGLWLAPRNLLLTGGPWSSRWAGPEGGRKGVVAGVIWTNHVGQQTPRQTPDQSFPSPSES